VKTGKTKPKTNKFILLQKKSKKTSISNKKTWFLQSLKKIIKELV